MERNFSRDLTLLHAAHPIPSTFRLEERDERFNSASHRVIRQSLRHVQTSYADPVVGHPVIHVKAVGLTEVVTPVDSGWKDNVRDGPYPFSRQLRSQHRFR